MAQIKEHALGEQGLMIKSRLGLGAMGMTAFYIDNSHAEEESLATLRQALDQGMMVDTADVYRSASSSNEELIGKVMKERRREDVFVATKFGFTQADGKMTICGKAEHVRKACEASLQALGTDYIDLLYLHRVDPATPVTETVAAMAELVREGKVRGIGLSEATPRDIRAAHAIHPISAYQVEYSLVSRGAEAEVIPTCRELGIGIVAYSPLGRGLLTGAMKPGDLAASDFRKGLPRWQSENWDKNAKLVETVTEIARQKGATPAQVALAWLLAQGKDIFPIPGTKRLKYLEEIVGALTVTLIHEDMAALDTAFPADGSTVAGARYPDTELTKTNFDAAHTHKE